LVSGGRHGYRLRQRPQIYIESKFLCEAETEGESQGGRSLMTSELVRIVGELKKFKNGKADVQCGTCG
jgi:hypothetical protein